MKRRLTSIALCAALCLPAIAAAGTKTSFRQEDVKLFRVKCGLCHGVKRSLDAFPGMSRPRRVEIVEDMAGRKSGWISDPERAAITALLATDDFEGLAAALERPKRTPAPKRAAALSPAPAALPSIAAPEPEPAPGPTAEPIIAPEPAPGPSAEFEPSPPEHERFAWRQRIAVAHGALMLVVFLGFALAAALSGLKRLLDKRKLLPRFPGAFVWKRHVLKGKIAALGALCGLGGGLAVFALDGFAIGAAPHFATGCAIAALYTAGGLAGLRLAAGRGTPALRRLHAACNLAATALFAANVVTGASVLYALFG